MSDMDTIMSRGKLAIHGRQDHGASHELPRGEQIFLALVSKVLLAQVKVGQNERAGEYSSTEALMKWVGKATYSARSYELRSSARLCGVWKV